jgi:hypothetical protein
MARRRIRRKKFECGHKGLGQYCHSCYYSRWGYSGISYSGKKYMRVNVENHSPREKNYTENAYKSFDFTNLEITKKKHFEPYTDATGST